MKLKCVRHDKRVQVIDMGTDSFGIPIALTVHRSVGKQNEICDSNSLTIGEEFFTPNEVLAFPYDEDNSDDIVGEYLNGKFDSLIYAIEKA